MLVLPAPLREVGEVVHDALRVCVKDARPVTVQEDTVLIVCIAPDVGASTYQVDPPAGARQVFDHDVAGVARASYQNIDLRG